MESIGDLLRRELERHFEVQAMTRLSRDLLGFEPEKTEAGKGRSELARMIVDRCESEDALQALADAILMSSPTADERLGTVFSVYLNTDPELPPGAAVGDLRVVKRIGKSGFGTAYLAETTGSSRQNVGRVVLKVLRRLYCRDRSAVRRLQTALRAVQAVKIAGLARVIDQGRLEDGRVWLTREYVQGQTLAEYLDRMGAMHFTQAKPLLFGLLSVLGELHRSGLVHGNVKTENVLIRPALRKDGGRGGFSAVLADGGLNRLLGPSRPDMKSGGVLHILGTEKSIAPEQARGLEADARSDIYAVGVLIYETLCGRPPFEAETSFESIARRLSAPPEPLSSLARRGWVPQKADAVVSRALARNPEERYSSAAELRRDLEALDTPIKKQPLNRREFDKAVGRLLLNPADEKLADAIERQAGEAGAFDELTEAFKQVASAAKSDEARASFLSRLARVAENQAQSVEQAKQAYAAILEIDPANVQAKRGMEQLKRLSGDREALLESLLDELEDETAPHRRGAILREAAVIYEKDLKDKDDAFVAWLQVLAEEPSDELAENEIERLAGDRQDRWNEALAVLRSALGKAYSVLFTEDGEELSAEDAQHRLVELAEDAVRTAEKQLQDEQRSLREVEQQLTTMEKRAEELSALADGKEQAAKRAQTVADEAVARYEEARVLAEAAGATAAQKAAAEKAGQKIDREVDRAIDAGVEAKKAASQAEEVKKKVGAIEASWLQANKKIRNAEQVIEKAKATLAAEQERYRKIRETDQATLIEKRNGEIEKLVHLYNVNGHIYAERTDRPEVALKYFSQALKLDPANERANREIVELYRRAQAWKDLSEALLNSAEHVADAATRRQYRAEAAAIIAEKLDDRDTAIKHFKKILEEDPSHPLAQAEIEKAVTERNDWPGLVELLEKRAESAQGNARIALLNRIAELSESRLQNAGKAEDAYRRVLQLDSRDATALKSLADLYQRRGHFRGLLEVLRSLEQLAGTPKARVSYLEKIGRLQEEQFVDYAEAARIFERIAEIDPAHEEANTALIRLYRQLRNFDALVQTLERYAAGSEEQKRKIELLLRCAHILMAEVGAPDRALEFLERVLILDEENAEALEMKARLKSTAGDLKDALKAVERLADHEQDPYKKAELLTRAGKLLEDSGNKDGAIERYRRALDLEAYPVETAEALRRIYDQRGDARGAIEILRREVDRETGKARKAELLADLGDAYRRRLKEEGMANECFLEALKLDPTCTRASLGLAALAYEKQNYIEYLKHFSAVQGRVAGLGADEARDLYFWAGRSFEETGRLDGAADAYRSALQHDPGDIELHRRLADTVLKSGQTEQAVHQYEQILGTFEKELKSEEKTRLLLALGNARMAAGDAAGAVEEFRRALGLNPGDRDTLRALTEAHERNEDWKSVLDLLRERSQRTDDDDEAFGLLARAGDIYLEKMGDRNLAVDHYGFALNRRPNDRNLLAKLMAIYTEAKDWERLLEVIVRIAEMVVDESQRSKYYETAAGIAHQELKRCDEAADYYEKSLQAKPGSEASFNGLVECLTEDENWNRLQSVFAKYTEEKRKTASKELIVKLLDARGNLLLEKLGREQEAAEVLEDARGLEPENRGRKQRLLGIYRKDPRRYLERITRMCREAIYEDPYQAVPYKELREVFARMEMADELWCTCQVLSFLRKADDGEENLFKRGRPGQLVKATRPETEKTWRRLLTHPAQDQRLTDLFAAIIPAVLATQSRPLSAIGLSKKNLVDPLKQTDVVYMLLRYVSETTFQPLPDVYRKEDQTQRIAFVFTAPPALAIGPVVGDGGPPMQATGFEAARHLSYFWPGHFIRQMVPTGTGMKAWVFAAIQMLSPRFPVPADMSVLVTEYHDAVGAHLTVPQQQVLISRAQKLLQHAPELDMKGWMASVDMTADRAGFVFANDLGTAATVIESSPLDASAIPAKERIRQLLAYAVSDEYFSLRKRLGIALTVGGR